MKSGEIAIAVWASVGALIAIAVIATHVYECVVVARKNKLKKIEDEEKARALRSPTLASPRGFVSLKSPVTPVTPPSSQLCTPRGTTENVRASFNHSAFPTSPTLTITVPLSPAPIYSPYTPISPYLDSLHSDARPLLPLTRDVEANNQRSASQAAEDRTHARLASVSEKITRNRLGTFATPPRRPSRAASFRAGPVILARSVRELVGRTSEPPKSRARQSRMGEDGENSGMSKREHGMQEVGRLGW